jgi:hypothetical protein
MYTWKKKVYVDLCHFHQQNQTVLYRSMSMSIALHSAQKKHPCGCTYEALWDGVHGRFKEAEPCRIHPIDMEGGDGDPLLVEYECGCRLFGPAAKLANPSAIPAQCRVHKTWPVDLSEKKKKKEDGGEQQKRKTLGQKALENEQKKRNKEDAQFEGFKHEITKHVDGGGTLPQRFFFDVSPVVARRLVDWGKTEEELLIEYNRGSNVLNPSYLQVSFLALSQDTGAAAAVSK